MNIYQKVAEFCSTIIDDKDSIFTAESLTTAFIDAQLGSDWPEAPDDMKAALYIGIQQIVRPIARRSTKDDEDPNLDLDLPEEKLLQDRYSIPCGKDHYGKTVFKYVPRHRLTAADVKTRCNLDRQMSRHFARRADALESWFYRFQSISVAHVGEDHGAVSARM